MALKDCGECGKQVSDRAEACPHCGARLSKPAQKSLVKPTTTGTGLIAKIFVGLLLLGIVSVAFMGKKRAPASASQKPQEVVARDSNCSIKKRDGTLDARECDLVEICKDHRFFKKELARAMAVGTASDREKALVEVKKVVEYLAEYRAEDVAAVCGGEFSKFAPPGGTGNTATAGQAGALGSGTSPCQMSAPPYEAFPIGSAFEAAEFQKEISRKCPGGGIGADGGLPVAWEGKAYIVQTTSHKEANGLLVYEVTSVRAK